MSLVPLTMPLGLNVVFEPQSKLLVQRSVLFCGALIRRFDQLLVGTQRYVFHFLSFL